MSVLDTLLTRDDLAKQLGVTTRTLLRWEVLRIGPPPVRIGRRTYYAVDSVAAWIKSREEPMVRDRGRAARAGRVRSRDIAKVPGRELRGAA